MNFVFFYLFLFEWPLLTRDPIQKCEQPTHWQTDLLTGVCSRDTCVSKNICYTLRSVRFEDAPRQDFKMTWDCVVFPRKTLLGSGFSLQLMIQQHVPLVVFLHSKRLMRSKFGHSSPTYNGTFRGAVQTDFWEAQSNPPTIFKLFKLFFGKISFGFCSGAP